MKVLVVGGGAAGLMAAGAALRQGADCMLHCKAGNPRTRNRYYKLQQG